MRLEEKEIAVDIDWLGSSRLAGRVGTNTLAARHYLASPDVPRSWARR
jgi:hypothetical protein